MDGTSVTVNIEHLQETLVSLRKYEPELFKALQKEAKNAFKPVARAVANGFPKEIVTGHGRSNWYGEGRYKTRFPKYDGGATKKVIITSSTSGKKAFARLEQRSPSGMVYDAAKQSSNKSFINLLDYNASSSGKNAKRSRVLFPQTKKNLPMVEKEVQTIVAKLNDQVARQVGYRV